MLPNPVIGSCELSWYALFQYMGVGIMLGFGHWYYKQGISGKWPIRHAILLFWYGGILALAGSRLAGMAAYYLTTGYSLPLSVIWQWPHYGHFSWCGSLLFLLLFFPVFGRYLLGKSRFWQYLDFVAVCLCMLTIITKQGCLFSGDGCYGIPTSLPWGMHFAYDKVPSLLPVHPTPLYDSLFHLFLLAFLYRKNSQKRFNGQIALLYFIVSAIFYLLLETIRINPPVWISFTLPQMVYLLVSGYAWYLYATIQYRNKTD